MAATTQTQLRDVTRAVIPADGQHLVSLTQEFPVTTTEAWSALTDPDRLARWFMRPGGDLHEGGRYELAPMGTRGTIVRCEAPRMIVLTWESASLTSELELLLSPAAEGTRLELRHGAPAGEHWDTYGPAATGCGWDGALLGFARHLDDPAAPLTEQMAGFETSPEGLEFTRETGRLWADAHIAAGADERTAREMAARTIAFYTGTDQA